MKTRTLALIALAVLCMTSITTQARVLNPNLGRWLSRDPIGNQDGANLYASFRSAPIARSDPDGLLTHEKVSEAWGTCGQYSVEWRFLLSARGAV